MEIVGSIPTAVQRLAFHLNTTSTMTLHAPQIAMIALMTLSTGEHLVKNGEPRDGRWSFGVAVLSDAIVYGLLYWGGFFG